MLQSKQSNTKIIPRKVALIGNPNSGKSTLFNKLTGANQQIGNWPGVTVEQKTGTYVDQATCIKTELIDLPGCYSLVATPNMALDEKITCEFVDLNPEVLYLNIVDATHLTRDLYLTLQLLEAGLSIVVVLNCMDLAKDAGIYIDIAALAQRLGSPVVPIIAKSGKNITALQQEVALSLQKDQAQKNSYKIVYPEILSTTLNFWQDKMPIGHCLRSLEGDILLAKKLALLGIDVAPVIIKISQQLKMPLDLLIATQRRGALKELITIAVCKQRSKRRDLSQYLDRFLLHKIFGPLSFIAIMYLLFTVAINVGGMLQLVFDQISEQLLVINLNVWLTQLGTADWLVNILAFGIGKGLNITVTFVPVLAAMFLCLGILESSGYMIRAAFIVDRIMRVFGLPGKAFVPMIVGFGCNVPAVMGTRTLTSRRERILTIMMTPFMSCSARLAIYAIFVAAFFPIGGQNIIFSLYVVGILVAVLTGFALRSTMLPSERSLSLMEMPSYRWPSLSTLLRQVWRRLKSFLLKAGGLIIVLCVIINGVGYSSLEKVGKAITPLFAPIGISQENWPATVGLVTGLIAKEAVIGTLNSVYNEAAGVSLSTIEENTLSPSAETEMVTRFGGAAAAYAYLLFTLLYFPCVSVVAVIAKELNKKWAVFSVIWSTGLAYIVAALFYQAATWSGFWSSSMLWIVSLSALLVGLFAAARWSVQRERQIPARYRVLPTQVVLN